MGGKATTTRKSILAVGARQTDAPIPGLAEAEYITNREALQLESVPDSMIVIGGEYVGSEFAQLYARIGTRVTLLGRAPQLMRNKEPELAKTLADVLDTEGITVHTGTTVTRAGRSDNTHWVDAETPQGARRFEAAIILLATGRVVRVDELGLEQARGRDERTLHQRG